MSSANYMQRIGHSRCIRCEFETTYEMSFAEQDAALMAHLEEAHPNWMFDNIKGSIETSWSRFLKRDKVVLPGIWKTCGQLDAYVETHLDEGDVWIGTVGGSPCSWTREGITDDLEKSFYQKEG